MDPDAIFDYCCSRLGVPRYVITSRRKRNNLTMKRKIIALLLLHFTDLKYEKVASLIERDRTLLFHYMKTFNEMDLEHISKYNNLKKEISKLKVMEVR